MNLSVHHFLRNDNRVVSVYSQADASPEAILADVQSRHGEVTPITDRTGNTRIIPDWKALARGFRQGNFKKVGR